MAKLNFNFKIMDLAGKPVLVNNGTGHIEEMESAGKFLANSLCQAAKVDAIRFFDIARNLYKDEPLDLNRSDKDLLKKFIEDHPTMVVLIKAQLLEVLDNKE